MIDIKKLDEAVALVAVLNELRSTESAIKSLEGKPGIQTVIVTTDTLQGGSYGRAAIEPKTALEVVGLEIVKVEAKLTGLGVKVK